MSAADATRTGQRFTDHLQAGLYVRIAVQRRHYEAARGWLARFTLPLPLAPENLAHENSPAGLPLVLHT